MQSGAGAADGLMGAGDGTCVFARSNAYLARRKRLPPEARNWWLLRFGRPARVLMQDQYAFLPVGASSCVHRISFQ